MRFSLLWLPVFVSLLYISCATRNRTATGTIRIHSELIYSQSGYTTQFDGLKSLRTSQEQRDFFSESVGISSEDIVSELSDPFVAASTEFISFDTTEPACKIARFYENEFLFEGWQEKRGILFLEMTNGGGDWLKVYKKKDGQILVHIIGPWDDNVDALKRGELTGRTVSFKFYHCTSAEVFGNDGLEKVKNLSLFGVSKSNKGNIGTSEQRGRDKNKGTR